MNKSKGYDVKVMIPQEEHPEINFIGLLIGPRGNILKSMESETGAKIKILGKGSKGRRDGKGDDEPLHAYITSTNPEAVKKAADKIRNFIKEIVDMSGNEKRKVGMSSCI